MTSINVECAINEEAIANSVSKSIKAIINKQIRDEITEYIKKYIADLDIKQVVEDAVRKDLEFDVSNEIKLHIWSGRRFEYGFQNYEPTAEELRRVLTANCAYADLLNSKEIQQAVVNTTASRIAYTICDRMANKHIYARTLEFLKNELMEKASAANTD